MLTFMNSKLRWMVKTSKTIFSKKVNPMKYLVQMHPIIQVWCIPLDHKIYTKCKKTSNLIKDISSHNICSGIKSQQVKKTYLSFSAKNFWFFLNFSVLFHQGTFDHPISCVLLIDKTNESCQNSEKFERNATSTTKRTF